MNPAESAELFDVTFTRYNAHVNPGMATVVKFIGYEAVEWTAEGCYVYGPAGERYLDCLGGPGVFTFGHRHPQIVAAVRAQLDRMPLSSHLLLDPVMAEASERLAGLCPGDLAFCFWCNSGAEAIEGALKVARMYTGRPGFVCAENAFHGKTFGALSASGREVYKAPFRPLLEGFTHVPFGDAEALRAAVTEQTAAVLLEPIQCEAGIIIPPADYLRAAREICDHAGALLILDEIQTGFGRTGTTWACDAEGVCPDIMTLGKALGGGVMPVGAFVARPAVWDVFRENPYIHTTTFGGNPLACSAALAAMEVLQAENIAQRCASLGQELLAGVELLAAESPDLIRAVRGRGLLVGLEFADADVGNLVIAGLAQHRILAAFTLNRPEVVRLEPPALITTAEINSVIEALRESLQMSKDLLQL
ncbi:MAG: aminotransferase class III-fold pyridoxal phosphate-dependent enzyme [Armatimonadetes bacterium]|nr:aminotransferase class III-fold pyridoxal phosphate-dependent enzyme [Armatimonadota bacterium]